MSRLWPKYEKEKCQASRENRNILDAKQMFGIFLNNNNNYNILCKKKIKFVFKSYFKFLFRKI